MVATNHFLSQELAGLQPYLQPPRFPGGEGCNSSVVARSPSRRQHHYTGGHRLRGDESSEKPFARIANDGTAISVLFEPAEMKMWLAVAAEPPVSRGEFIPIDVRALLALPQGISTI